MESTRKDPLSLAYLVANHVSAMLSYWDKDCICRFANDSYMDWFGKSNEEMIGVHVKDFLGPLLYEMNVPYLERVLAGQVQSFERIITTISGEKRNAIVNYFPNMENGEAKGFFVLAVDISAQKQLEEQLKHSNEVITDQNKRLLNFANIVSHNLRSYANNFDALISMMQKPELAGMKEEIVGQLEKLSKSFSATILNLNEISRVQNLEIKQEKICLKDYVAKAIDILHMQISANKAFVFNKVNPDAFILGDPAYLESVMLNFLSNALKYHHPERDPLIVFENATTDQLQVLTIRDNGIGIDLDKYGKDLFGLNKTFHGNSDAQGVGLYISKYQIERMGGEVKVESKVDEGTSFHICFPMKE